jgi:hypothetical protein
MTKETRGSEEAEDDRNIKMKGDGWDMEISRFQTVPLGWPGLVVGGLETNPRCFVKSTT